MAARYVLTVVRRLDNRIEGEDDRSDRALELHNLRKEALHEALEDNTFFTVADWGRTDDTEAHEYVDIVIVALQHAYQLAVFSDPIVSAAVIWLAKKLAEKAVVDGSMEVIKRIVGRLWKKQKEHKFEDFRIKLPDGTEISVRPAPTTITIAFKDGSTASLPEVNISGS